MRRILSAAVGLVLAGSASVTHAQVPNRAGPPPSGPGEIRGTVATGETNEPLQHAGVAVRSAADSSIVSGAITEADGSFHIRGLRPGTYFVRVTLIGFAPQRREVSITPAAPAQNLGIISMSRVAVALQGVEVVEESPTMTIEPDRNAYRAKEVAPTASNASDVLENIPSVSVDGEGKVSLRGNENVAIQINGRPSPVRGTQLASYLKSLPANIVERIEVIPNPSAKYDPEGMAGIINIVLKAETDLGLSAGLTAGMAETDRYNVAGNVGYQSGPITLFTNLGINGDDRGITGVNDRERYDDLDALTSVTEQDVLGRQGGNSQNFNANLDYRITPKTTWSNVFSFNNRDFDDLSVITYSELDANRDRIDFYNRPRNNYSKGNVFDYTMALRRVAEARKNELSTEIRFNRSHDEDEQALWRQDLMDNGSRDGVPYDGERSFTDALTRQLTGQIDWIKTLGSTKLETGYKGNVRWLERDYLLENDPLGDDEWVENELSNNFDFDEAVHAVYGVVSRQAGKAQLQAGLRAEYADRTFSLEEPAESYPYDYTSLFPSGIITYNTSEATQLKASYSRRIRRPGTQELNPFPWFFDVQNVLIGNPALNPEYTDAIELGWSRTLAKGSLQFSPFYRRTSDIIRVDINTQDTVAGREVTSVSFQNLESSNSWGADVNGSMRFGQKFNGFGSFNVFKMVTDGGSTSSVGSNAVTWSARMNATSQITSNLTLQGSYFYRAPMTIERGKFSAFHGAHLSARYKLNGDKAVVGLRLQDPFNTMRFQIRAGDGDIVQLTSRRWGARSAWLTFQFNYGQAPRIRERPQEQPQGGTPPFGS
jgi:outer membrane receptor protein involved in Fe transport